MRPLEIWGGIECTLNRVGDRFVDQCEKNGHYKRLSDLKLFHELGIKKLRYPCLWEKVAPKDLDKCSWRFLDERLSELHRLGQHFIAGLLHHGSGPVYTSLIDPDFPVKLQTYARLFASRYPWVRDYTPINEINTTARFSTLYGHWYPHLKNELMYWKSILLQCRGTVLAMREIRAVNPEARLIQTDDIGKCQGTPELAHQVEFENERRWLAWDLLCGKVNKSHPLYKSMVDSGITIKELDWFEENPCPPDVIGLNHYQLSNRYLDHRLEMFPKWSHGGNGKDNYADIGAVDTGLVEPVSVETILRECWQRFGLPIAITECHIRGRRESQMRWLKHVWDSCINARTEGITIEAVTAWSLLGTYDWHNLCTQSDDFYEPGVFDLRHPERTPQETGLAKLVRELASTGSAESPLLDSEGTWKTARRMLYHVMPGHHTSLVHPERVRPLLITGGSGTLGQAFARVCGERNIKCVLTTRTELDISSPISVEQALDKYHPWAVINAAGFVRVDEAEDESVKCYKDNVAGTVNLAQSCRDRNIKLVSFSSDLVFDGKSDTPYRESSEVMPLNIYGKTKVESEVKILALYPEALVVRTSSFFGPWDEHNFVAKTLKDLATELEVKVLDDVFISPTYVPDLAHETLDLLIDGMTGIVHITNMGKVSWKEFALLAAEHSSLENERKDLIKGVSSHQFPFKAPRPRSSALMSERHQRLSKLENALERYFKEVANSLEEKRE